MPRSPRRSRSPEPSRRSGYKSSHRSPSPTRSDRRESSSRRDEKRYDDRDRNRDRTRDRDRDRERERERDRPRERRDDYRREDDRRRDDRRREDDRRYDKTDRRDDRDDRRRPPAESSRRSPPRSPAVDSPKPKPLLTPSSASPASSPGPQTEEEKQRIKKERLEAWKKARELAKGKDTKTSTPEPDLKPSLPKPGLPSRPNPFVFNAALSKIGLPMKPTPLKRSVVLDEEDAPDRKFQKLDLPDVNPEVQSGEAAKVEAISADLDVVDGNDEENEDDTVPVNGIANGVKVEVKDEAKDVKMEVEEEEEDPLEAFMKENIQEVKNVNRADASRLGIAAADHEDEEEQEIKNKLEEELASKEAILAAAASKSRKKDLPTPDHANIKYEPFRKAFYSAPVEVQEMDDEEAELLRLEMDGIKIRGQDAPRPVKNWGAFGLPTGCIDVIKRNEWTGATAIQAQAIPAIMSGRDVIGVAKTGSGKTIAFTLPLLRHINDQRPVGGGEGPIAIVMSPTRELAMQIYKEAKPFLKVLGLRGVACYGGSPISEDIASMKKGAEVVVCTPGRMIDLLTANNGRVTNLRRVTYLVLDEADRMFDMGFEPQVMKIINNIRPDAQKVLFSATFPKTMDALARKILVKPLEITVGGRSVVAPEIDQRVEVRDADTKFTRLLEVLGEMSQEEEEDLRALIFVDRQEAADDLFRELLQKGYVCSSLHGGKDQVDRDEAITNFKNGDVPIIVATSVAARGLDVKELKLVINYDAPNHMEDYVHRAGRTGRAGNKGVCLTFITPDQEKFSVDIVRAMQASNAFVPPELEEMSTNFLAKIKSGKARAAASGYAGKGLERIERRRDERERAEKTTYGDTSEALSLSSREGAVIPYKPKGSDSKPAESSLKGEADYTFTEIKVEVIHGPAPDRIAPTMGPKGKVILPATTIAALEKAKAEGRHVDAARLAKVVAALTQSIELTKAEKLGAAIAPDAARKTKDPDATDYHAIFPINDYPQKARWKATNKEQMTLMAEISGASITNKGIFYPPGEEPGPGMEPKLHLLIESNDEFRVRAAVDELRRVLVDASLGALNNADRAGAAGGRYAV